MLYWNVQSDFDGEATIEITYFTSGITWSADYLCIADKDEKQMKLRGLRPRLPTTPAKNTKTPRSGWWSARSTWSRRSPQLAQMPMAEVDEAGRRTRSRAEATRPPKARWPSGCRAGGRRRQAPAAATKEIIKEGLSEYFIYTIEGTETIPNGWSKRLRSLEGRSRPVQDPIPLPPAGIWRPTGPDVSADQRQGLQARHYAAARRHRSASSATTAAMASPTSPQQNIKYIPIGDKIELNLGADPK